MGVLGKNVRAMKLSRYFLLFILFDMANFLCKTCETSLENKEDCALHEEAHRREGVKAEIRVVCKDCFREYSSVKNYRDHQRLGRCFTRPPAMFKCKVCSCAFSRRGNLLRHEDYQKKHSECPNPAIKLMHFGQCRQQKLASDAEEFVVFCSFKRIESLNPG